MSLLATDTAVTCVFQPIVDLTNGRVVGYEALGRITGREAEGFAPVQHWMAQNNKPASVVHRRLFSQALRLGRNRPAGSLLFINITYRLVQDLNRWVARRRERLDGLVLEVPELTHVGADQWARLLEPLRAAGAQVALDDYGSGVQDLTRLVALRPDYVKVAGAIASRATHDRYADRILESLVHQARLGDFLLVVEEIEDPRTLHRVAQLGIRYGQGYLLGRPARRWSTEVHVPTHDASLVQLPDPMHQKWAHALGLTDDAIAALQRAQDVVARLLLEAGLDRVGTAPGRGDGSDTVGDLLAAQLSRVLRGQLTDDDRRAADALALDLLTRQVPLPLYLLEFLRRFGMLRDGLSREGRDDLVPVAERACSLDLSLLALFYAQASMPFRVPRVMSRRRFLDEATALLRTTDPNDPPWSLVLLQLRPRAWRTAAGSETPSERRTIQRILAALAGPGRLVGKLSGLQYAVWIQTTDPRRATTVATSLCHILQELLPDREILCAVATDGQDGHSVGELRAVAVRRLGPVRS
jgi:EAL domain-containing protein (putative c-di-GMP-specific phosphodiesterase class I)